LTNPKGLLFFAAFLPQFIDPARSLFLQFVIMAGTFAAIEIATEVLIASISARALATRTQLFAATDQRSRNLFMVFLPIR
jgi:threonine/homoserine/homoserine lactone efflux protein